MKEKLKIKIKEAALLSTYIPAINTKLQNIFSLKKEEDSISKQQIRLYKNLSDLKEDKFLLRVSLKEFFDLSEKKRKIVSKIDFAIQKLYETDNFILEVNSGLGGKEAIFFAEELCSKYKNLLINEEDYNTPIDKNSFRVKLKDNHFIFNEMGVHRVQRIPVTESSGRIHTSTVIVYLRPILETFKVVINNKDLNIERMRSSGAGGQHVNTTSSAVRITHIPTGIWSRIGTNREQERNKEEALDNIKKHLKEEAMKLLNREILEKKQKNSFLKDRSKKIRTYNFIEDRLTDHRVNFTVYDLKNIWNDTEKWKEVLIRIKNLF